MSALVVNCKRVKDARRAMRYDMRVGRHELLGTATFISSNLSTSDAAAAVRQIRAVAMLRQDVEKPFLRVVISADGVKLTRAQWSELIRRVLKFVGLDLDHHPFAAFRHDETDHQHCHITVCRVSLAGALWHGQWELVHLIKAVSEVASQMGLALDSVPEIGNHRRLVAANRARARMGLLPLSAVQIARDLKKVSLESNSLETFVLKAAAARYEIERIFWPDGREKGLALRIPATRHMIGLSNATGKRLSLPKINVEIAKIRVDSLKSLKKPTGPDVDHWHRETRSSLEEDAAIEGDAFCESQTARRIAQESGNSSQPIEPEAEPRLSSHQPHGQGLPSEQRPDLKSWPSNENEPTPAETAQPDQIETQNFDTGEDLDTGLDSDERREPEYGPDQDPRFSPEEDWQDELETRWDLDPEPDSGDESSPDPDRRDADEW